MMVYADKSMVETILRNLLSNAIKFTDNGGAVRVTAVSGEGVVEIAVADTGVGLTKAEVARLLRRNAHDTHVGTRGEPGAGLGLNLCKQLVAQHQGALWIDSQPGRGTTFRFTLPGGQEHGQ
jgi:two-component system, sensor histidine kinase and response regulator